jgi:serine/threonine protein kinase/dienelactone hydrolase
MRLEQGTHLGPYTILALLGQGGMGEVYRARDERLQRDVAVKVLPHGVLSDEAARNRFRKEALALARLSHPNIAAVFDVGEQDGVDYIVMECVPGQSLSEKLKSGLLPTKETVSLAVQVAGALEEAHEQGVIHRDLKPSNIMVTPKGHVKVLDFGLAKLLDPIGTPEVTLSFAETRGPVGTVLYMSPEQAEGKEVDSRTDLWSLGVVLYESLVGRQPFQGSSVVAILRAITGETPKSVRQLRPDAPQEMDRIVGHALEKDSSKRYQSASEMSRDLSAELLKLSGPVLPPAEPELKVSRRYLIPAALLFLVIAGVGGWLYERSSRRHWAKEEGVPEIAKLRVDKKPLAAFLLSKKVRNAAPGDQEIAQIATVPTVNISIGSSPDGASVDIQDYLSPDGDWYRVGVTPLTNVEIPRGYFRWKIAKASVGEYVSAPITAGKMNFPLDAQIAAPEGMVYASGGSWTNFIAFVGMVRAANMSPYYIDRYEVTNRQYQEFVDKGGYEKRDYWTTPFTKDGHEVNWEDAKALFRDASGRAGPSTWQGGHYPEGQADFPVSGVSWYEASAYAAFAGKSLPTFSQWFAAAPTDVGNYTIQESNFSASSPAAVGKFMGLGRYGTYDMAGNVSEWVQNSGGDNRNFILGGAWKSQTYMYTEPELSSAWDRSPINGFRCVRNTAPPTEEMTREIKGLERDFSKIKPVDDQVFQAYQTMYAYDKSPLDAKVEGVVQETADWTEQKISYNTAYNGERMSAYLFLPKKVKPPFQTVVFFPSARVYSLSNSKNLGDVKFFDYIVQSGRAVLYPIYQETYERTNKNIPPGSAQNLSYMTQRSKDVGRSLDYLASRADIDKDKLAYLGVSMGSAEGVIYATVQQDRLKTAIFLDGGYFLYTPPKGGDQIDFAPRLKKPVLMVNGRYDYAFSLEKSQIPLFDALGTQAPDKQHIIFDTPHDVTERRPELIQVVVAWLDKYLGRID